MRQTQISDSASNLGVTYIGLLVCISINISCNHLIIKSCVPFLSLSSSGMAKKRAKTSGRPLPGIPDDFDVFADDFEITPPASPTQTDITQMKQQQKTIQTSNHQTDRLAESERNQTLSLFCD